MIYLLFKSGYTKFINDSSMHKMKKIILIMIATLIICSCGQRGPLYLPENQPPQNQ